MKKLKELRALLASTLFNFKEQELPNGDVLLYEGDELVEGMEVKVSSATGEPIPANGTYEIENKKIEIENGIVKTITEIKTEEAPVELIETPADIKEEVIEEVIEAPNDNKELLEMIAALNERLAKLEQTLATTEETVTKLSKVEMAEPVQKNPVQLEKAEKGAQVALKYFNN